MPYCIKCNNDPCECPPRSAIYGRVADMSAEQKNSEIGSRIVRLGEIRGERAVSRAKLDGFRKAISAAKESFSNEESATLSWPNPQDVNTEKSRIASLNSEAETIILELKDLGVDSSLLRINGS